MEKLLRALWRAARATGVAFKAIVRELRDALRENGYASWSRYGSAAIVASWCYVLIRARQIPERTEQAALLIAALYGANQLKQAVESMATAKQAVQIAPAIAQAPTDQAQQTS